jgi:hypothetical protein
MFPTGTASGRRHGGQSGEQSKACPQRWQALVQGDESAACEASKIADAKTTKPSANIFLSV